MNASSVRNVAWLWSMVLVAAGAIGCDDDRRLVPIIDSGLDATMPDAGSDAASDSSMDASTSPADQLQGLWEGLCGVDPGGNADAGDLDADAGPSGESTRQGFAFRGNQFVARIERYFDPACVTPIVRLQLSGTFTVGDPVSSINGAHELDVAIAGFTAQILDPDFEDLANAERFLGFDDWDASSARNVLGVDVFGTGSAINGDSVVYQIFQIGSVTNGSVELPVLYLGDETQRGPALSNDRRPTALSNAPHAYAGPVP